MDSTNIADRLVVEHFALSEAELQAENRHVRAERDGLRELLRLSLVETRRLTQLVARQSVVIVELRQALRAGSRERAA